MARINVLAEAVKGIKANIHAVDNLSPVSRVAVYVRAGSRYEPDDVPGIAHYMRAAAGLTTSNSSQFAIARHPDRLGARIEYEIDREYIIYRVQCLRDRLGSILGFIDDTLHKPEFRSWELHDHAVPYLKAQAARLKKIRTVVVNEAMHKAAYRGGLAHSTIIPEHQIEKIKNHNLRDYLENNYVLERMSFTGVGVDEGELRKIIENEFDFNQTAYSGVSGASRYTGGEARIQFGDPETQVNFVVQGAPISDLKSRAVLEVISTLLGQKKAFIKYGQGSQRTLGNLLETYSPLLKPSLVNVNHSDTGLFGITITGPPDEKLKVAVKDAVKLVKQQLSSINETDLNTGKKAAVARALVNSEDQREIFDSICRHHAAGVPGKSPIDYIEKLSLKDVQSVTNSLLKSKPTLVAVGNPRFVPYVDEIDS